jgi:hypothetical protein
MDHKKNNPSKLNAVRRFFYSISIVGVLVLIYLLLIPGDPQAKLPFGYSPARLVLLILMLAANVVSLRLALMANRNTNWVERVKLKIDDWLGSEVLGSALLGFSLFLVTGGVLTLISTYTQTEYRISPHMLVLAELVKAYMTRLAPFVLWLAFISLHSIYLIHNFGFGVKSRYRRVFQFLSITTIPLLILFIIIINIVDQRFYHEITKEDNYVEWLTVLILLISGVLSFIRANKLRKSQRRYVWFYVLFGIFFILSSFEEISWAQRIFDVDSTEYFIEHSDQQEINVHNVFSKWSGIRTKHVAAFVLFLYGSCLPLLTKIKPLQKFVDKLGIPVPPLILSLSFALSAALLTNWFSGREEEVGELALSICLFLFLVLKQLDQERDPG